MLKQPENIILNDFKQHRAAALDVQLIGQYEELVQDWISTIETMLNDTSDERYSVKNWNISSSVPNNIYIFFMFMQQPFFLLFFPLCL